MDDGLTGDAVCAVVVPAPGARPTAERLARWCRQQLAGYKVSTRWHFAAESLPRTASGKRVKRAPAPHP
ncbi:MAG TPA: hypothetical protein VI365_15640 [Trebonia sp.]